MTPEPEKMGKNIMKSSVEIEMSNMVSAFQERERERSREDIVFCLESVRKLAGLYFSEDAEFVGLIIDDNCVHPLFWAKNFGLVAAANNYLQTFYPASTYGGYMGPEKEEENITDIGSTWKDIDSSKKDVYERGDFLASDYRIGLTIRPRTSGDYGKKGAIIFNREQREKGVSGAVNSISSHDCPFVIAGLRKAAGLIK